MLARSLYFSTVRRPVARPATPTHPAPHDPWHSRSMPSPGVLEIALWLHRSPGQESVEPPCRAQAPRVDLGSSERDVAMAETLPRVSRRILCDSVRLRTVRAA